MRTLTSTVALLVLFSTQTLVAGQLADEAITMKTSTELCRHSANQYARKLPSESGKSAEFVRAIRAVSRATEELNSSVDRVAECADEMVEKEGTKEEEATLKRLSAATRRFTAVLQSLMNATDDLQDLKRNQH